MNLYKVKLVRNYTYINKEVYVVCETLFDLEKTLAANRLYKEFVVSDVSTISRSVLVQQPEPELVVPDKFDPGVS